MAPVDSAILEMNETKNISNDIDEAITQESSKFLITLEDAKKARSVFYKIRRKTYFALKRVFDIFCSLIGMLMVIPVAIITKICYILTGDKKSIFYKQKRIGKDGKEIFIYKFRSMVHNADEVLENMLKDPKYKKEWDLNQKFEKDPRITKFGNILRKTSLDELPQFINVIKGDMSIIGPRPLIEGELDAHIGNHMIYESVKPGISGWWAANGRSATTYERRLELEYYYCRNCNIILDMKCIFLTIAAVVLKRGAK